MTGRLWRFLRLRRVAAGEARLNFYGENALNPAQNRKCFLKPDSSVYQ